MNKIKIFALFGEAGSGKDYLLRQIIRWDEEGLIGPILNPVIKTTTRPMRENEKNGEPYFFISEKEFKESTTMCAISCYRDWYYGIDIQSLSAEKPNIVILDLQQMKQLIKCEDLDISAYRIIATPKTRLLRQLNREQNPNVDEIVRRFNADKEEYLTIDFKYKEIKNETPKDADDAMLEIFRAGANAFLGKID